jgi:predicted TIM-barrel fold metal-dependent hydrolase
MRSAQLDVTPGPDSETPFELPNIVSVDDHIVEPQTLWQDRLPERCRAAGPQVVRELVSYHGSPASRDDPTARWSDVWYYDGLRVPTLRIFASSGLDVAVSDGNVDLWQSDAIGMTYDEMRPGCFEPSACLQDMDLNGVDASLGFPNLFMRFCGQIFLDAPDKDLSLLCVKAYNDWLMEEWERTGQGRLIGATIVPLWDAELAAAEVRRNAARGAKAVCFSEIPAWLGLPSLHCGYWDPYFAACADTQTLIAIHIGSSSSSHTTSDDAPPALSVCNLYTNSSLSLSDFLLSGLFDKYPNLRIAYAEAQAGWIPYIVERLDSMWSANHKFMRTSHLREAPSTYYREHIYSCVFDDRVALERLLDKIGVNQICFETDYPHADSSWPHSKEVAERNLAGLNPATIQKIVRDNAIEMLRLDQSKFPLGARSLS